MDYISSRRSSRVSTTDMPARSSPRTPASAGTGGVLRSAGRTVDRSSPASSAGANRRESLSFFDRMVDSAGDSLDAVSFDLATDADLLNDDDLAAHHQLHGYPPLAPAEDEPSTGNGSSNPATDDDNDFDADETINPFFFAAWAGDDDEDEEEDSDDPSGESAADPDRTIMPGDRRLQKFAQATPSRDMNGSSPRASPRPASPSTHRATHSPAPTPQPHPSSSRASQRDAPSSRPSLSSSTSMTSGGTVQSTSSAGRRTAPPSLEEIRQRLARIRSTPPPLAGMTVSANATDDLPSSRSGVPPVLDFDRTSSPRSSPAPQSSRHRRLPTPPLAASSDTEPLPRSPQPVAAPLASVSRPSSRPTSRMSSSGSLSGAPMRPLSSSRRPGSSSNGGMRPPSTGPDDSAVPASASRRTNSGSNARLPRPSSMSFAPAPASSSTAAPPANSALRRPASMAGPPPASAIARPVTFAPRPSTIRPPSGVPAPSRVPVPSANAAGGSRLRAPAAGPGMGLRPPAVALPSGLRRPGTGAPGSGLPRPMMGGQGSGQGAAGGPRYQ
ncbi:hypothetical protein GGF31_003037 [Allomyces arbusculus]|nr:hypothetical protein GGF31_003037 [Allomyces arbusculus]